MRLLWIALVVTALLACNRYPPTDTLRTEFTPIGPVDEAPPKTGPIVSSVEEVKVYYKSSPNGFTLRDNEIDVESGYRHKLIGELRVRAVEDQTNANNFGAYLDCKHRSSRPAQKDVLDAMQREAYRRGANAVIYAYAKVSQSPTKSECERAEEENDFGGGWAVFLSAVEPPQPEQ